MGAVLFLKGGLSSLVELAGDEVLQEVQPRGLLGIAGLACAASILI